MMCLARFGAIVPALVCASLLLTSCGGKDVPVARGTHPGLPPLLTASKADLVKSVDDFYAAINSFSATARLTASVGSVYTGKIHDYTEVTAYIDFRKPSNIRILGLIPVISTTAFTMVSDGSAFKVSIPPKNRFLVGANDAPPASQNKLENIRPEMFISAMLVKPIDAAKEMTLKVDDITEKYAFYQLAVVKKISENDIEPDRRVTFDRVNLLIVEQRQFDPDGSIVSLAQYSDWQVFSGIRFPSHIKISRPKEELGLELTITKMDMNIPIADSKFVLEKPEGFELQVIGSGGHASSGSQKAPKGNR
jgi:outer membrane lipoprotein-sorting protein